MALTQLSPGGWPGRSYSFVPAEEVVEESDSMKNLTTAIFGHMTGAFKTLISGRMYKIRAPQKATYPYVVFYIVNNVPRNTFTENIEDTLVQFSIFSTASSSLEIEDIYTELIALYDNCRLTITGNTHIKMDRESSYLTSIPADTDLGTQEIWQYDIEYSTMMKQN
jgi:hypothetical protein